MSASIGLISSKSCKESDLVEIVKKLDITKIIPSRHGNLLSQVHDDVDVYLIPEHIKENDRSIWMAGIAFVNGMSSKNYKITVLNK
jgi:hypothetical protein